MSSSKSKKQEFIEQYLGKKKIEDFSNDELKDILKKLKNHFIFYKKITEEPQITKSSMRYKESNAKMKALRSLKDEILVHTDK